MGRRGCDGMVVGFTTTCAINAVRGIDFYCIFVLGVLISTVYMY